MGCPVAVSQSIAINNHRDYTLLRLMPRPAFAADRNVAARDVGNEGGRQDGEVERCGVTGREEGGGGWWRQLPFNIAYPSELTAGRPFANFFGMPPSLSRRDETRAADFISSSRTRSVLPSSRLSRQSTPNPTTKPGIPTCSRSDLSARLSTVISFLFFKSLLRIVVGVLALESESVSFRRAAAGRSPPKRHVFSM